MLILIRVNIIEFILVIMTSAQHFLDTLYYDSFCTISLFFFCFQMFYQLLRIYVLEICFVYAGQRPTLYLWQGVSEV